MRIPILSIILAACLLWGCAPQTGLQKSPATDPQRLAGEADLVHSTPGNTEHYMVAVPAGAFKMGSHSGRRNERPVHSIFLSSFYMDMFEVTNAQFVAFLNDLGKNADRKGNPLLRTGSFNAQIEREGMRFKVKSAYRHIDPQDHPVIQVTWYGARAYCEWAGLRLPTEAEWEKAARGTNGQTYPWGEDLKRGWANSNEDTEDFPSTAPVGYFSEGVSPYGVHDTAGNVSEWVQDRYAEDYYYRSPKRHPEGPASGLHRVHRGGSWKENLKNSRVSVRHELGPTLSTGAIGFRCAKSW